MGHRGSGGQRAPYWTVQRLLSSILEAWDEWDGQLTLEGVDLREWSLPRMINAFEAAAQQGAKDESEWAMTRAKLYAPPREPRPPRVEGPPRRTAPAPTPATAPPTGGFDLSKAQGLMAVINAENKRLGIES